MIGCFFGKKIHKLKTIKPQELIEFQNRYYDNHGYFPSPALRRGTGVRGSRWVIPARGLLKCF